MSGAALFVYGTLQFPEVLVALLGRTLHGRPAWLPDHARLGVRGEVFPGLVPRAGATTAGLLYEDVDAATLLRLDAFEGELYERRRVVVRADPTSRRAAGRLHGARTPGAPGTRGGGSRPHGRSAQGPRAHDRGHGHATHGSVHGSRHAGAASASSRARGPATGELAERVPAFAWIVARASRGRLVEAPWDEDVFARMHLPAYVGHLRARAGRRHRRR